MLINCSGARLRIEKEYDLINHRVTWCAASNAFLFVAYSNLSINSTTNDLIVLIPFIGFSLCLFVLLSVVAAYFSIWRWLLLREKTCDKNFFCDTCISSGGLISIFGNMASVAPPIFLLTAWAYIFLAYFIHNLTAKLLLIFILVTFLYLFGASMVHYYRRIKLHLHGCLHKKSKKIFLPHALSNFLELAADSFVLRVKSSYSSHDANC